MTKLDDGFAPQSTNDDCSVWKSSLINGWSSKIDLYDSKSFFVINPSKIK